MLDVRLLMDLGLAPKEAEIVVHMATSLRNTKKGYFEAADLAKDVGVPREKIYTYLKQMEGKGVIEAIGSRPKSFSLLPVDQVLDALLRTRREEAERTLGNLGQMVKEAKRTEYASLLPRISILRDGSQYVRAMIDTITSSERVMIIARTSALLLPWERERGPGRLLEAYRLKLVERATAGRLLVDYFIPFDHTRGEILERAKTVPVDARRAVARMREFCTEDKHPNISVRNMAGAPAISLIIGHGRVALGFTSEEEARTAKGVLVESGDFHDFMSSIYDMLLSQPEVEITPEMIAGIERDIQRIGRGRVEAALGDGRRDRQ
jgi:sugar-specific transcriptional regulator TrmB